MSKAMTRIEEIKEKAVSEDSLRKWSKRLRDWGDNSDLLAIFDELLVLRDLVERMKPFAYRIGKRNCYCVVSQMSIINGKPCLPCQARALLVELEGKP